MSRRSDHQAVERLRTRTATWEDRQDATLAGLLALTRSADALAPAPAVPVPHPRRRALPALAGVATTAVAGAAFVLTSVGTAGTAVNPTTSPTTSVAATQVTKLLDQVRTDLTQADDARTAAARKALLAHAAATLTRAQQQTTALPPAEQTPLRTQGSALGQEIQYRGGLSPRSTGTGPAPQASPRPSSRPAPQPTASAPPPDQQPPPPTGQQPPPSGQQPPPPR